MTTTPPLRSIIAEPPTPLHGPKFDTYEPYTIRKSLRFSKQRATRTPSPSTFDRSHYSSNSSSSKKTYNFRSASNNFSPPSSSPPSPQNMTRRNAKSSKAGEVVLNEGASDQKPSLVTNMLPTPVKTPRKKVLKPELKSAARVLFPERPETVEEAMPSLGKRGRGGKKHIGFSFDDNVGSNSGIEIFTDSKDKVPELDESEDNPFYEKPGLRSKKGGSKKKNSQVKDQNREVQEVLERDQGMIYVFRGKKIYRRFDHDDHDEYPRGLADSTNQLPHVDDADTPRHFTRSSIKPRFLFPPKHQQGDTSDEEAVTDIEDEGVRVWKEDVKPVVTPTKPTFAPPSPPTTHRTTRSTAKRSAPDSSPPGPDVPDSPHFALKKAKRPSPFNGWQRTKRTEASTSRGKKRIAEDDFPSVDGTKRLRSSD